MDTTTTITPAAVTPPPVPSEEDYAAYTPEQRGEYMKSGAEPASEPNRQVADTPKVETPKVEDTEQEPGEVRLENGTTRDTKTGRFVPYEVLGKTRTKLKDTETQLATERQARAQEKGRYDELSAIVGLVERINGKGKTEEAKPEIADVDPTEDVIGAVKAQGELLKRLLNERKESDQRTAKQTEAKQIETFFTSDFNATKATTPDLGDAHAHLLERRKAEYAAMGITGDTFNTVLAKSLDELVRNAKANGQSPSKVLYDLAVVNGYKRAEAKTETQQPTKTDAERKIEDLKAGMNAGGSLSNASGGGSEAATIDWSKMGESEYSDLRNRLSKAEWRKLMGG